MSGIKMRMLLVEMIEWRGKPHPALNMSMRSWSLVGVVLCALLFVDTTRAQTIYVTTGTTRTTCYNYFECGIIVAITSDTPLSSSVHLIFTHQQTGVVTDMLLMQARSSYSLTLKPFDLTSSTIGINNMPFPVVAAIVSGPKTLIDGNYTLTARYQRTTAGNPVISTTVDYTWTLFAMAVPPTILCPLGPTPSPINMTYYIPDGVYGYAGILPLSLKLSIVINANLTLVFNLPEARGVSILIDARALNQTTGVSNYSNELASLPSGTYLANLSYSDTYFTAGYSSPYHFSSTAFSLVVDYVAFAPTVTVYTNPSLYLSYTLPELPLNGSVVISWPGSTANVTGTNYYPAPNYWIPQAGLLTAGTYTFSVTFQDALGNPSAVATTGTVIITNSTAATTTTTTSCPICVVSTCVNLTTTVTNTTTRTVTIYDTIAGNSDTCRWRLGALLGVSGAFGAVLMGLLVYWFFFSDHSHRH